MIKQLYSKEFIVYGVVGVIVTLIKLLSLYVLRDFMGLHTYLSVAVSYTIAVVNHFFINKHLTFKITEKQVINTMTLRYFTALIVAFVVYTGNIWILHELLQLHFYLAVMIALLLSYIFNYFLYKNFVFVAS